MLRFMRLTHFIYLYLYISLAPPASLSQLRHFFNFSQGLLLFLSTVTECQIITAFEGSLVPRAMPGLCDCAIEVSDVFMLWKNCGWEMELNHHGMSPDRSTTEANIF
uniref:Uncharacterized protein n=1 Tax=Meloidogyne enterolobii TaxID=390850 RepID=A0A6V7X7Q1_MELEN|nr:unnamed protein product [Meloidogyne enterolobii]